MNTIQQNKSGTQSFGMLYKSPKKWGEKTLHTFIESDLRKSIDKKYPLATASYNITKMNKENAYFLDFTIKLNKRKKWSYNDSTIASPQNLDSKLSQKLKSYQLETLEKEILSNKQQGKEHLADIKFAQKENKIFFLRKLMELFNIDPKSY